MTEPLSCPVCGRGDQVWQTTMAFLGPDVFRDSNTAECTGCNVRGTVGDWLRITFLRDAVANTEKLREQAAQRAEDAFIAANAQGAAYGDLVRSDHELRTKLAEVVAERDWLQRQFPDQVASALGMTSDETGRTPSMVAGSVTKALVARDDHINADARRLRRALELFRAIGEALGGFNGLKPLAAVQKKMADLAAVTAQRDELLRDISAAVQTLREVNERSAKPDEKRGLCSSAFCNGNHHDSACEGDYLTSRWIESMSDAIARAKSGQPAQRDDDGTASGGGARG